MTTTAGGRAGEAQVIGSHDLAKLLPPAVHVAALRRHSDRPVPALLPEERPALAKAVPGRREEFAWGRCCARRALAELGLEAAAVPMGPDRAPVWPEGVVGSITHCEDFVAAAVVRDDQYRGLGIDVELETPLPGDEIDAVCTPRERSALAVLDAGAAGRRAKLIFSAKESLHKCVAPLTGVTLDFQDVSLELDESGGGYRVLADTPASRALVELSQVEGRFASSGCFVLTAAWLGT